jgi:formylglycine-generating enzyme
VWEWCGDGFDDKFYRQSLAVNPIGPWQAAYRVIRGGSWNYDAGTCRSAYRSAFTPDARYFNVGFRVTRVQTSSSLEKGKRQP